MLSEVNLHRKMLVYVKSLVVVLVVVVVMAIAECYDLSASSSWQHVQLQEDEPPSISPMRSVDLTEVNS